MGEMKDRMLAGQEYVCSDPDLHADQARAVGLTARYNTETDREVRTELARELFGAIGEGSTVRAQTRCDYGYNVHIGDHVFVNWGSVLLDVGRITIGDHCQIGPNCQFLTATHPLDPEARKAGWEGSAPITLEENVWFGGGVIVLPGVTIGADTVVGAGSVVTRDLPPRVLALGNPARVVREL